MKKMNLINRDDIHITVHYARRNGKREVTDALVKAIEEAIFKLPVIDAEPVRHGKWIGYPECLRYEKALTDDDYACSCCGEVFSCIDNDMERFDYCPHCGAKMDAQEDGECQTGLKEH